MKQIMMFIFLMLIFMFPISTFASDYQYKSATEYDYPPFSVTTNDKADGFSVELLKAVADVMDLNITFKIDTWFAIKEELKNGNLDILPLVGYTEDRDQYFDFTVPYIIMHGNIFVRVGETEITSEEDLIGKSILVMNGDNAHEYALRMNFSDNLILTQTYLEAFELLSSGKYDAILAQSLVGEKCIEQLNITNVKALTKTDDVTLTQIRVNLSDFEQKFCFAVKEGNKELLSKLNEGLAIISSNGTYHQLYEKWFPFLISNTPNPIEIFKISLIILTPILLLILFIGTISVKRKIKQKTQELDQSNKAILDMEAHLKSQQRLESIGVLARGVAHEINNPINGILNYSQLIYDATSKNNLNCNNYIDSISEYSSEIIKESNRISSIVSNLLNLSNDGGKNFSACNIEELINKLLSLVKTTITQSQIKIQVNIDKNLPIIECQEQEIQHVLLSLIVNAKDALDEKYEGPNKDKSILITATKAINLNSQNNIRITIEDHGKGIQNEIQSKIFDPFFTTKSRATSTGLGLSICHSIIKEHNGVISFETKEGLYTKFHIDLPVKQNTSLNILD